MEEKEWRLVGDPHVHAPLKHRPGRFGVLPYCELPLCANSEEPPLQQIIVGPNDEPKVAKAAVLGLLHRLGKSFDPNRILISKIPLRY